MTPHEVRYSDEAATDVAGHRVWYANVNPDLERRFVAELDVVLARIALQPGLHPMVHLDRRRARFRRLPYAVTYRFDNGVIEVIAVTHDKQDPQTWQSRT